MAYQFFITVIACFILTYSFFKSLEIFLIISSTPVSSCRSCFPNGRRKSIALLSSSSPSSFRFRVLHVEANQSDEAESASVVSCWSVVSSGSSVVVKLLASRENSSISFRSTRVFSESEGSYDRVLVRRFNSIQSSAGPTSFTSRLSRSAFSSVNGGGGAGTARHVINTANKTNDNWNTEKKNCVTFTAGYTSAAAMDGSEIRARRIRNVGVGVDEMVIKISKNISEKLHSYRSWIVFQNSSYNLHWWTKSIMQKIETYTENYWEVRYSESYRVNSYACEQ